MILLISLLLFIFDGSDIRTRHVLYDNIEHNIVLDKNGDERFRQFVFWKDGCTQGYILVRQTEFIDGPIKSGNYYIIMAKYKNIYYFLKSKTLTKSTTSYDIELQDLKLTEKKRKYNVRQW